MKSKSCVNLIIDFEDEISDLLNKFQATINVWNLIFTIKIKTIRCKYIFPNEIQQYLRFRSNNFLKAVLKDV